MSNIVIYHHNDLDGKGAAAIFYNERKKYCTSADFIMKDYSTKFDPDTCKNKDVYILDLSFKVSDIEDLFDICKKAKSVTWIDHHESSYKAIKQFKSRIDETTNLAYYVNKNGCGALLTYLYLHGHFDEMTSEELLDFKIKYGKSNEKFKDGNKIVFGDHNVVNLPSWLVLIDKWDRFVFGDEKEPVYLQFGSKMFDTAVFKVGKLNSFWQDMITANYYSPTIKTGKTIFKYLQSEGIRVVKRNGYTCNVDGYKALVINALPGNHPKVTLPPYMLEGYDIIIVWDLDKKGEYTYTAYSSNPEIDCTTIAEKRGGGGHKGAAGFRSKVLLFKPE